ncbi:MAG: molybdate ABC transporter substrate-binding protein [Geobacteraceae bacterium GWC2_58_44]|nr:MAG: molybdate ABC transporter substrate-binding protein [Geobacteraceae bacterium GWC2_58_44]HBG06840.1 molybdate ABC transporter substrate-binding protein [Geobacter sp.]
MRMLTRTVTLALCGILFLASSASAGEIAIAVAASLKEVMNELTAQYQARTPGVAFRKNYGGSGTLAKQIENGAPSDLFISASPDWMDYLKQRKLVDPASVGTFAGNVLVFAGTTGAKVAGMRDLPALSRVAIGSPKSVPAGEYALEAMNRSGVWKQLEKKLVMARDVREALMYAERGEVDGALVYRTDALLARKARILFTVPEALHTPIVYPVALTAAGAKKVEARAFLRFLHSAEAKKVLARYGFSVK